jgi:hypothetical protein
MHVLTGSDGPRGMADHLAVFENRTAFRDIAQCDLVPARDTAANGGTTRQGFALRQIGKGDGDGILGMKKEDAVHGGSPV